MAPIVPPTRPRLAWLPLLGIGAFLVLYFCAASLYPGGTHLDPHTRGYSHAANYWCDLLDPVACSGEVNRGRPLALIATVLLPLSLVPLWLEVPRLFRGGPASRWIVRVAGPAAMVLSTLVFTRLHDLVIDLAAVLGFAAFVTTLRGLARAGRAALVAAGLAPLVLGLANYLLWRTGTLLWAMPAVQKAAYASFFVWVVLVSRAAPRAAA